MSLEQIEVLARKHADDRTLIAERVQAYQDEIDSIKRRKLPGIKSAVSAAKDSQLRLHAAIDTERELFNRPRTRVFHGIKVGLQKGKGKLSFVDAKNVVALIRKHLAAKFTVLVRVAETPIKKALLNLPGDELKKIGCTVTATGDEVVVTPADGEIDKLVSALLGSVEQEHDDEQEDAA